MSFVDFGYDVFSFNSRYRRNVFQASDDSQLKPNFPKISAFLESLASNPPKNLNYAIINQLIDLGIYTENELAVVRSELAGYKKLKLTKDQLYQIEDFQIQYKDEDINRFTKFRKFGHIDNPDDLYKNVEIYVGEITVNDWNAKVDEMKELTDHNKKLRMIMKKFNCDIENSSSVDIEDAILKMNEELELARKQTEELQRDLESERQAKSLDEKEIKELQHSLQQIQTTNENLIDEIMKKKLQVESFQRENTVNLSLIKQLQQDRETFSNMSNIREKEIEKLLIICKNLDQKYNRTQNDIVRLKEEIQNQERIVEKCQREGNNLVIHLADCLGRADCLQSLTSGESDWNCVYQKGQEFTRELIRIVREHESCHKKRDYLLRDIERLPAITQKHGLDGDAGISRKMIMDANNYQESKIDNCTVELTEEAFLQVANKASHALEKLDKKINDHDVYRRYESLLLLELQVLQETIEGTEQTINGTNLNTNNNTLEISPISKQYELERQKLLDENNAYVIVDNSVSKKIMEIVQNLINVVIKIRSTLTKNPAHIKLIEIDTAKIKIEKEYEESQKKTKELTSELERLNTKINICQRENREMRKKITTLVTKLKESQATVGRLNIEINDPTVESQEIIQARNEKLKSNIGQLKLEQLDNVRKEELENFTGLHNRILELVKEKEGLLKKITTLETQLANFENNNNQMQNSLNKWIEDNHYLESYIKSIKSKNGTLETIDGVDKSNLSKKCDDLLEKIEKITQISKETQKRSISSVSENVIQELQKEIKCHRDKLMEQEKELLLKEKEILKKTKQIEMLNKQIHSFENDIKEKNQLTKRIEILIKEKSELLMELKQTSIKYEDKLAEMQKQYKHKDIELQKKYNDSMKRLETKYTEILKAEGKIVSNSKELRELQCKLSKPSLLGDSACEKNFYENQRKGNFEKYIVSNLSTKRFSPIKKNVKSLSNPPVSILKPNSRLGPTSKEISSFRSVNIPQRDTKFVGNQEMKTRLNNK